MGFTELLTIVFIVLKLLGVISWSWGLVLLPEIIAVAIYLIVFFAGLFGVVSFNKSVNKHFKNF
jgi:hypothetical protein